MTNEMQRYIQALRRAEAEFNEVTTTQQIDAAIYRINATYADIAHLRVMAGPPIPRKERQYRREVEMQIG